MKLMYCKECGDIVKLTTLHRACMCKKSSGYYINAIVALISGPCLALGFDNRDFYNAVRADLDKAEKGIEFLAFVIPNSATSVKKVRKSIQENVEG